MFDKLLLFLILPLNIIAIAIFAHLTLNAIKQQKPLHIAICCSSATTALIVFAVCVTYTYGHMQIKESTPAKTPQAHTATEEQFASLDAELEQSRNNVIELKRIIAEKDTTIETANAEIDKLKKEADKAKKAQKEAENKLKQEQTTPANQFSATNFSDTLIIGDSIISGANAQFEETFPGATIDADPSRTFETGGALSEYDPEDGMIDSAKRNVGKYSRYIIECGINDSGFTQDMANQFLEVLSDPNIQIFFVNQYVTTNEQANQLTNTTMQEIANEHNNVFVVDWLAIAKDNESDYLIDICHLNETGAAEFANTIYKEMINQA